MLVLLDIVQTVFTLNGTGNPQFITTDIGLLTLIKNLCSNHFVITGSCYWSHLKFTGLWSSKPQTAAALSRRNWSTTGHQINKIKSGSRFPDWRAPNFKAILLIVQEETSGPFTWYSTNTMHISKTCLLFIPALLCSVDSFRGGSRSYSRSPISLYSYNHQNVQRLVVRVFNKACKHNSFIAQF